MIFVEDKCTSFYMFCQLCITFFPVFFLNLLRKFFVWQKFDGCFWLCGWFNINFYENLWILKINYSDIIMFDWFMFAFDASENINKSDLVLLFFYQSTLKWNTSSTKSSLFDFCWNDDLKKPLWSMWFKINSKISEYSHIILFFDKLTLSCA
jgi:hypothetical protein